MIRVALFDALCNNDERSVQCARRILNESLNFQESRSPPPPKNERAAGRGAGKETKN